MQPEQREEEAEEHVEEGEEMDLASSLSQADPYGLD